MKKRVIIILLIASALIISSIPLVFGWGVWGHNHINKGAILALPAEMGLFFYDHTDFIVEESTVPDIRKHMFNDKTEASKHYIDLERYTYTTPANMPEKLNDAIAKYGKDTLEKYGILPWNIEDMMVKLTDAMKNKRKTEILYLAADLGHYIADAYMPLHTTINHNGQLTDQKGIHAFFEGQLPELFGKNYNLNTGEAKYIKDIPKETWSMVQASFMKADTLLAVDRKLKETFPREKIYRTDSTGNILKNKFNDPVHSYDYAKKYHEALNGMVERQIREAIKETANFWYTAWVNAGKPYLSGLDPEELTKRNEENYKKDVKLWQQGKVSGFKPEQEFNQ